jgi:hypothetical protein
MFMNVTNICVLCLHASSKNKPLFRKCLGILYENLTVNPGFSLVWRSLLASGLVVKDFIVAKKLSYFYICGILRSVFSSLLHL